MKVSENQNISLKNKKARKHNEDNSGKNTLMNYKQLKHLKEMKKLKKHLVQDSFNSSPTVIDQVEYDVKIKKPKIKKKKTLKTSINENLVKSEEEEPTYNKMKVLKKLKKHLVQDSFNSSPTVIDEVEYDVKIKKPKIKKKKTLKTSINENLVKSEAEEPPCNKMKVLKKLKKHLVQDSFNSSPTVIDQVEYDVKIKKPKIKRNKTLKTSNNENIVKSEEEEPTCNKMKVLKKRKKHLVQDSLNSSPTVIDQDEYDVKIKKPKIKKKKTLKTSINENIVKSEEEEEPTCNKMEVQIHQGKLKKKKKLDLTEEEYKPGMLSDFIQMEKYGRVIIPWDPSFGLDKSYKIPIIDDESLPKLKINPLFDLSKRKDIALKPFGEKTLRSVFVGNLPSDINVNQIKKLFRKCGLIHQIKIRNRNLNHSKEKTYNESSCKNALVTFKEAESCVKALKLNGRLYKDHHLRVDNAKEDTEWETRNSVFVGNLATKAQDDDLWKAFEDCGEIESVRIVRDEKGKGKGIGYVNFKNTSDVEKALELDGIRILERSIRVRQHEIVNDLYEPDFKKKRRNKKKKKKSNTDQNKFNENDVQENNCKETKVKKIDPEQVKLKKNKVKQIKIKDNVHNQIKARKKIKKKCEES